MITIRFNFRFIKLRVEFQTKLPIDYFIESIILTLHDIAELESCYSMEVSGFVEQVAQS